MIEAPYAPPSPFQGVATGYPGLLALPAIRRLLLVPGTSLAPSAALPPCVPPYPPLRAVPLAGVSGGAPQAGGAARSRLRSLPLSLYRDTNPSPHRARITAASISPSGVPSHTKSTFGEGSEFPGPYRRPYRRAGGTWSASYRPTSLCPYMEPPKFPSPPSQSSATAQGHSVVLPHKQLPHVITAPPHRLPRPPSR